MSVFKRTRDPYPDLPVRTATAPSLSSVSTSTVKEEPPVVATVAPKVDATEVRATARPVNRETAAVVDKRSKVKGTLHSEGDVLIEGCFEGEIEASETVWVDKSAQTQAQLHANDAVISGTFGGELDCRHRLQIDASATVSGEIRTPVLVIEEGATVNCRFSMTKPGGLGK